MAENIHITSIIYFRAESRAKRIGFNPSYAIKHPTIKVELQNLVNRRIETDIFKTITMDYDNFEFICRYLES